MYLKCWNFDKKEGTRKNVYKKKPIWIWNKERKTANSFYFSFFILLSLIYSLLQKKAAK